MGARNSDVDAWLATYENPMKPLVERVREIVLEADERIGETIKWSTPTFVYKGNLASFQPRAKQFVSIKPSESLAEAQTWLNSELATWRKITAELKIELAE